MPNAFVQTYQYDSLYRLTDANEMAGSSENWSEKFTYDRYGNRDKKFRNGLEITNNALSHPSIDPNTNRFTTTGYGYDKVGNLVTDAEGRNFTFDGNNKQRIVYDGNQTVGEYFYDGDGMRVKKKVYSNGTHTKTVVFVYSGGKLIEEYSTEAPPTDKKIKYLTKDHLGTPRIITDGNGAVVSRRDFMPFGEEIANNVGTRSTSSFKYSANEDDVRQKFTGYQQDSETNLDFAEARMYENRHARFTAVDPLLASGNNTAPQTFNRFIYCGNNPIACTDPTGLVGWVTHDGQMKYDSEVNSQEDADRIYGAGNASYTADGSEYTVGEIEWTVLEGGRYKINGDEAEGTIEDQATLRGANNSGGGGPSFAFINPSPALFRFTIRPFLPRPNRNNVRGPYNRLPYNQFARTPNRYVVPPPAVGNATRMFNPNNPYMGTGIGGELYGPPSPTGMVNAPHVRNRRGRNTNCVIAQSQMTRHKLEDQLQHCLQVYNLLLY